MSKKNVVGYVVASAAAFGLGYVVQPAPTVMPNATFVSRTDVVVGPKPVPPVYLLGSLPEVIVVEKEPTPHPTVCDSMHWTQ